MRLTAEKKSEIISQYGGDAKNTGHAEAQVALFTHRISHLTEHLKKNKKDFSTELTLVKLVGKRRQRAHQTTRYQKVTLFACISK